MLRLRGADADQGAVDEAEDPLTILAQMRAGLARPDAALIEPDRATAIARAVQGAAAHDVVLIAGKGHEDYQEINGQRHDFSDLAEADKALTAWEVAHA